MNEWKKKNESVIFINAATGWFFLIGREFRSIFYAISARLIYSDNHLYIQFLTKTALSENYKIAVVWYTRQTRE